MGAIESSYGNGAGSSTKGAYRAPLSGVGVTMTELLLVSTRQMSLGWPVPDRSLMAMPAPTDEIHA